MSRKDFTLVVFVFLLAGVLPAQQKQDSKKTNIIETLTTPDSISHATVKIHQDRRIDQLLSNKRSNNNSQETTNGYRVQVFSSNVLHSAKTEAFKIERQIRETFPDEPVYVNYLSPFWKVRVGDFLTQKDAQSFRTRLIESFPGLKSEIYVVREQIIISVAK